MPDIAEISEVLRLLGIGGNRSGHRFTASAVMLALEEQDLLLGVTKQLYPAVAAHYNCKWQRVERGIRSAAARAWKCNPAYLMELARYPMVKAPTSSEFVDILASYFLRSEAAVQ